nr:MAG TPA: hypothetical protein [Caudoviricetes sp.]
MDRRYVYPRKLRAFSDRFNQSKAPRSDRSFGGFLPHSYRFPLFYPFGAGA